MFSKVQLCKREIDEAISLWKNAGGLGEPEPEIMRETSTAGFYIAAIPPGGSDDIIVTWPNTDLDITLSTADALMAEGYDEIVIYEDDFGIPLSNLSKSIRDTILENITASNGESTLMELMEEYLDDGALL